MCKSYQIATQKVNESNRNKAENYKEDISKNEIFKNDEKCVSVEEAVRKHTAYKKKLMKLVCCRNVRRDKSGAENFSGCEVQSEECSAIQRKVENTSDKRVADVKSDKKVEPEGVSNVTKAEDENDRLKRFKANKNCDSSVEFVRGHINDGDDSRIKLDEDKSRSNNLDLFYLFSGNSKQVRFFIFLWMVMNLGLATAAPSIFDSIFGRRSFDPFKCGCSGGGSKRGRVVGGSELAEGSAPWLVAITKGGKSHCGSALISRDHILTAAHCIDGIHMDELRAWMGVHSLSAAQDSSRGHRIHQAYPHPQFQLSGFHNDIAVLELQHSVRFSSTIRPICLPSREDAEYAGRTAIVAGWGKTAERDPPSDLPRQAYVQVWTKSRCRGSGYPAKRVSGEVICAGLPKGGVDACQGDSGGPLIIEGSNGAMEVIGVVSWGRGCARPNLPGVYTRVASYITFIQNIISNSCT